MNSIPASRSGLERQHGGACIGLGGGMEVGVDYVGGVGDDIIGVEDDDDDDDGKMQDPELGFVFN